MLFGLCQPTFADQTSWLRGSYRKGTEKERTIFPSEQLLSPLRCWRKTCRAPHSPSPPQFPSPSLFHLWALAKELLQIFHHLLQVLLLVFFFFLISFFFFFSGCFGQKPYTCLHVTTVSSGPSRPVPCAGRSMSNRTPPRSCSGCPS